MRTPTTFEPETFLINAVLNQTMIDAERIKDSQRTKLEDMKKVMENTGYETALTVCGSREDGTEHSKEPILGSISSVSTGWCEPGTKASTHIHTHSESPPSSSDLRRLHGDDADHCILTVGVKGTKNGVERSEGDAMLVCMTENDSLTLEEVGEITREPESPEDHLRREDIERLSKAGIEVSATNF